MNTGLHTSSKGRKRERCKHHRRRFSLKSLEREPQKGHSTSPSRKGHQRGLLGTEAHNKTEFSTRPIPGAIAVDHAPRWSAGCLSIIPRKHDSPLCEPVDCVRQAPGGGCSTPVSACRARDKQAKAKDSCGNAPGELVWALLEVGRP